MTSPQCGEPRETGIDDSRDFDIVTSTRLPGAVFSALALSAALVATPAPAAPITFAAGCAKGDRITIAAVGDLLFHKKLQVQALRKSGTYRMFWSELDPVIAGADLAYGNLEGPAANGVAIGGRKVKDPGRRYDDRVYQSSLKYLSFNYHPSSISDIKASGFDVVSTANNHAMDRSSLGVDRTIDNLVLRGLAFTGTRKSDSEATDWGVRLQAGGLDIAVVACSYSTNGLADRKGQVLLCYKHQDRVLDEIRRLSKTADAVILTPHWGVENSHRPDRRQQKLARAAIDAGAVAVLGAHPHVLQPWEKYKTADGRDGLIVYSMGNFISNQRRLMQRVGGVVLVELTRTADKTGKRTAISAAGHIPTWVVIDHKGHRVTAVEKKMPKAARKQALRLWPKDNLVAATWPPKFPRACK